MANSKRFSASDYISKANELELIKAQNEAANPYKSVEERRVDRFKRSEQNSAEARKRASLAASSTKDYDTLVKAMETAPKIPATVNTKAMAGVLGTSERKLLGIAAKDELATVAADAAARKKLADQLGNDQPIVGETINAGMAAMGNRLARIDTAADMQAAAKADPDYSGYAKLGADAVPLSQIERAKSLAQNKPYNKVAFADANKTAIERAVILGNNYSDVGTDYLLLTLTDDEKNAYNYFYGKGEFSKADTYLDRLKNELEARWDNHKHSYLKTVGKESPVAASIIGRGYNLASTAELGGDLVRYAASKGKETPRNEFADMNSALSEGVTEDMSPVGKFLYNTAMSAADSIAVSPMGTAGGVILGAAAMASATNEALDKGMSAPRAVATGLAAGIFEGLFERFSLGNLKALKDVPVSSLGDEILNVLKSMGVNATEESATEAANILYNAAVNGEYADYTLSELFTTDKGFEALARIGEAGLSGIVMGGGFGVIGNASANVGAKIAYSDQAKPLVLAGLAAPEGSKLREVSRKNIAKLDDGKKLSGRNIRYQLGAAAQDAESGNKLAIPSEEEVAAVARGESIAPKSEAQTEAVAIEATADAAEAAKAFSANAQKVFDDLRGNEYADELRDDPDVKEAIADMDSDSDSEYEPSNGVVAPRDANLEYAETGKLIPDTAEQELRKAEAAKATNDTQRSGILAGAKDGEIKMAKTMSKILGRNIIFMSDDIRVNGKFEDGTIFVNTTRGESVFSQIVAHELTHSVESTKGYGSLVNAVKAFVDAGGYKDADGNALTFDDIMVEAHAEQDSFYKERLGKTYTDTQAEAEAVAKVLERMFADTSAEASSGQVALDTWLAENVATNKNAISRMWYALSKMAMRIRSDIRDRRARGREGYDADAREAELMLRKIEDIRDRFARALVQAKKAVNKSSTSSSGAWYSISPALDSDLDKVLNGTFNAKKGEVYLGETSNFMTEVIGAESLKLTMPASKVYSALVTLEEYKKKPFYNQQDHYHGIGKEDFLDILEKSENPVAAFAAPPDEDGNSRHNRIVLVTDKIINDVENGGKGYAVVVEEVDTHGIINGKIYSANKAITVYPRGQIDADINRAIADGRILDIKTKKDQLSAGIRGSNPQASIRKTDLTNNIAHFWANVKWEKEENKIFSAEAPGGMTAMQAKLMEAGLIDADGNAIDLTESEETNDQTNFSVSSDTDYIGYRAVNDMEERNRERALELYRKYEAGGDIGLEKGEDVGEYIFTLTGWTYDNAGKLIVDHEFVSHDTASRQAWALNKWAHIVDAENRDLRSENEAVRKERDELKARVEAAEKAKRILERDMKWRIAADRQLSPNFTHSRDQVRGIVKELCDMFGGHYNDGQIRAFTERLQELYDKIGTDAKYAADLTKFSREISDIITDMQDVRIKNPENAATAEQLRAELRVPLYLSEPARAIFKDGYGKVAQKYRSKVNFASKERGTAVDKRYMELSAAFPEWFPEDIIEEGEQAMRILEVADAIREKDFTSMDRYQNSDLDLSEQREADFSKAMVRILNGYAELEAVPVTFADGLMRQLEYERRSHQRELARMTEEEREKAEKKHNQEVERLMREAEEAMAWETRRYNEHLSEALGVIKARDDAEKAKAEAAKLRAHKRGGDISDALIKASREDGSFTKKMNELYERHRVIEDELARVIAECKKFEKVSLNRLSEGMREHVKFLRERRDALKEDSSNLAAYINKVNERVKNIRFKTLVELIQKEGYLKNWKDKVAPIMYATSTMRRNVLDIAPKDSALAEYIINEIIDPTVNATAMATRIKNDVRDRVRALKLNTKANKGDTMTESQFVQAYAEAKDNIKALETGEGSFIYDKYGNAVREGMNLEEWRGFLNRITEENKGITGDKDTMKRIDKAVSEFKQIYDDLFALVNAARIRNGYAPVPYHRGYFPHYNNDTMQDNVFAKMLDGFGLRVKDISEKLPTSINGLTATFRPGIRYMGNAKQRSMAGFETEREVTGAVEGIDRYIEVAADVAFLTDHVQELRSLVNAIRYATTSEATKERIDEIRADDKLAHDEKQERIKEVFANVTDKTKYALSNFVVDLEEYANLLAGKKSKHDREWESVFGRAIYNLGKKMTRNVGANQIVGNISSWITNTVPLNQGTAVMHYHMLTGLFDMVKGKISDDGFAATSDFLTNRRGSDRLIKSKLEKASDIASFGMPLIDKFVSEWLMRARVAQNMSKFGGNMSRQAAIEEADTFISGMMANRTKAEMPTLYSAQNPLVKMFTTYQLEVANNFEFYKDLWRDDDEKVVKFLAQMFVTFLLSRIYNDYFEELTGRRPAFDPLEMVNDLAGDLSGYKLASFDEILHGDFVKETKKKNAVDAVYDTAIAAIEEIPLVGSLVGGGRIPISSAMPDFESLKRAFEGLTSGESDEDSEEAKNGSRANDIIENLYKGLSGPFYYGVVPFAGGALKKVVEGGVSMAKGGSYTYNTKGERLLQYPVYQDSRKEAIWNGVKSMLFGKTSTEGGKEWVEDGFGYLSAKNTELYESLVDAGTSQHDAFDAVNTVRVGEKQIGKARALLDIDYLTDSEKFTIFESLVTESKTKIAEAQAVIDEGGDFDAYLEEFIKSKESEEAAKTELRDSIVSTGVTEKEATQAIEAVKAGEKQVGKARALLDIEYLSDNAKLKIFESLVTGSEAIIDDAREAAKKKGFNAFLKRFISDKEGGGNSKKDSDYDIPSYDVPKIDIPKFDFNF